MKILNFLSALFLITFFSIEFCFAKIDDIDVVYQVTPQSFQNEKERVYGDINDIIKRGEIVVCSVSNTSNPLFLMKKKGSENKEKLDLVGADIELAKRIAKGLGVRLLFRLCYKSYEDVVKAIAKGEGDIGIAKLSYTTERSRKVMYTEPYVIAKKTLLMSRQIAESNQEKSVKDLINDERFKIGVAKGASYVEFAKLLFPKSQILELNNWEKQSVEKLKNKEIIATLRDNLRVNLLMNQHPELSLKFIPIILKGENDYISGIVNYKSLELLNWINKFLESEIKIKSIDDLMKEYKEYIK